MRIRHFSSSRLAFYEKIGATLESIKNSGTFKQERTITSPQQGKIVVEPTRSVINFCANNYLGLCNDPSIKEAAKKAIDTYGAGLGSVRFICGTQVIINDFI